MNKQGRILRIENALSEINPSKLRIIDNSQSHAGHLEYDNSDDSEPTHITIEILSDLLKNESKVKSHRMIMNLIKSEFEKGLHAVNIKIL